MDPVPYHEAPPVQPRAPDTLAPLREVVQKDNRAAPEESLRRKREPRDRQPTWKLRDNVLFSKEHIFHLSIKKACRQFGDHVAMDAVQKEFIQLHDRGVWEPIPEMEFAEARKEGQIT